MTNGVESLPDRDNTPLEGSPFTPRQVRILKIAVVVMGVLLIGGFLLIIATIAFQASQMGLNEEMSAAEAPAGLPQESFEVTVPQGSEIAGIAVDGDRLVLRLKTATGDEIMVIDLQRGRVISRIGLQAE